MNGDDIVRLVPKPGPEVDERPQEVISMLEEALEKARANQSTGVVILLENDEGDISVGYSSTVDGLHRVGAIEHIKHALMAGTSECGDLIGYVARKIDAEVTRGFMRGARFLEGLELRRTFDGRPGLCRGYAIVTFTDQEFVALGRPGDVIAYVESRLELAARDLGAEVLRHLRGEGTERSFVDARKDAVDKGHGVAVSGLGLAKLGDVLQHLGGVPHVRADDGRAAEFMAEVDAWQVIIRMLARVEPMNVRPSG